MKKNYFALLLAVIYFLAIPNLIAQDESILSNIYKRLRTPGYESRHDHKRMLFVGEIVALGPVSQGIVICKQAISEPVDFRVLEVLLGDPPEPVVHTGYTNCTNEPLPSPPFTLHAKVIVYCFHNPSFKSLKCLAPITFTEDHVKRVKSWIAELNAANAALRAPALN